MHLNRREILSFAGSAAAVISGAILPRSGIAADSYSDRKLTDDWIVQWMQSPAAAVGELHLGRFADAMYFLRKPIKWAPNPGQKYEAVVVPVGFVTDFASIPRLFWTALPKDGLYTYPAIIHDFNYWQQDRQKDEADSILKYGLEDFKVNAVTATAIYQGVRLGGGPSWADNASRKKAGEKRILQKFPTSPTVTWEEWKKDPGNFKA